MNQWLPPFTMKELVKLEKYVIHLSSSMIFNVFGLQGKNSKNEDVIVLLNEWPVPVIHLDDKLTKELMEEVHFEKFLLDLTMSNKIRYDGYERGDDPPDFYLKDAGVKSKVDMIQFCIQKRRQANALFNKVKQKIMSLPSVSFQGLVGKMVYVYFSKGGDASHALPFKISEKDYIENFISELKKYRFCPSSDMSKCNHVEAKTSKGNTASRAGFSVTQLNGEAPMTKLFLSKGFEIGLAYWSSFTPKELKKSINKVVKQHDKKDIDTIVITVCGPDRLGCAHLSEAFLMDFVIERDKNLINCSLDYIDEVYVHYWITGKVVKLFPKFELISAEIFQQISCTKSIVSKNSSRTDVLVE